MYEVIRSNRKTIAIQIKGDGRIIVRAPLRMAAKDIQRFVDSKAAWIEKHLAIIQKRQQPVASAFTLEQLHQLAEAAKQDIPRRVARFAALVGVTYLVFTTEVGTPYEGRNMTRTLHRILREEGLGQLGVHALRHPYVKSKTNSI